MAFTSSQELTATLQRVFDRLAADPQAVKALTDARLILRMTTHNPPAVMALNARKNPPQLHYAANHLRPDLEIYLSAETLEKILRRQVRVRAAIASGQLKVIGPVWKAMALQELFDRARDVYEEGVE
jgi:alkyl sulfatase BDS1-like metallo-beta-lactamase superfamily hydrolase